MVNRANLFTPIKQPKPLDAAEELQKLQKQEKLVDEPEAELFQPIAVEKPTGYERRG